MLSEEDTVQLNEVVVCGGRNAEAERVSGEKKWLARGVLELTGEV